MFVEPTLRLQSMIQDSLSQYPREYNLYNMKVKHGKELKFFMRNDINVYVIDETFSDMFSTAFVRILNLPSIYVGNLETYKMIVYLLYQQLLWWYDDVDKPFAFFMQGDQNKYCKIG